MPTDRLKELMRGFEELGAMSVVDALNGVRPPRSSKPKSLNRWHRRGPVRTLHAPDGETLAKVDPWSGLFRIRIAGELFGIRAGRGEAMREARRLAESR